MTNMFTHTSNSYNNTFLIIDKPKFWTSFQVVKKIRKKYNLKKVGHAGTLDPLATGVLVLGTGRKTKQLESVQATAKEYEAEFIIGATTPSLDAEFWPTEIQPFSDTKEISWEKVISENFRGQIEQIPPRYSAVKIKGKRAWKQARQGHTEFEIKPRTADIYEFQVLDKRWLKLSELYRLHQENNPKLNSPEYCGWQTPAYVMKIKVKISCSKGTYVRSLARDLGEVVGSKGYVLNLRRTRVGEYTVTSTASLELGE
jgi:tRNA pseudouridine55 synthase